MPHHTESHRHVLPWSSGSGRSAPALPAGLSGTGRTGGGERLRTEPRSAAAGAGHGPPLAAPVRGGRPSPGPAGGQDP